AISNLLALPRVDRALKLLLCHPRAPLDAEPPGFVVELFACAALRAVRARPLSTAAARGRAARRAARPCAGLARARALLVHGTRGDLLRASARRPARPRAVLDVLVLPGTFRAFLHP